MFRPFRVSRYCEEAIVGNDAHSPDGAGRWGCTNKRQEKVIKAFRAGEEPHMANSTRAARQLHAGASKMRLTIVDTAPRSAATGYNTLFSAREAEMRQSVPPPPLARTRERWRQLLESFLKKSNMAWASDIRHLPQSYTGATANAAHATGAKASTVLICLLAFELPQSMDSNIFFDAFLWFIFSDGAHARALLCLRFCVLLPITQIFFITDVSV